MSSHGRSTPQVHQIKAIFEGFRNARSRSSERTSRGTSHRFNRSTDRLASRSDGAETAVISHHPAAAEDTETIESLIDVHKSVTRPARPTLSAKPSWIGPPSHSRTPRLEQTMARRVTITYGAPGLRPPVFITTSLSDPAWDVIEMPFTRKPHGEYLFHVDFHASEGEYQYKFRLGPGDWWVCDDSKPTIDDGFGNRNNVLYIESNEPQSHLSKVDSVQDVAGHALKIGDVSVLKGSQHPLQEAAQSQRDTSDADAQTDTNTLVNSPVELETGVADRVGRPSHTKSVLLDLDIDDDEEDEEPAPLLRHETNSPDQREHRPCESPVTSPAKSTSSRSSFDDVFCPEADPNDPSLHHFPTHHEGIINEIKRAHRVLPEDQTNGAVEILTPTRRTNGASNPILPSVSEAHEEVVPSGDDEQLRSKSKSSPSITNGDRYFNHSHAPAHHHSHHRKSSAPQSSQEDPGVKVRSNQAEHRGGALDNIREAVLGLGLAVIVAVIALALYRSGWLGLFAVRT